MHHVTSCKDTIFCKTFHTHTLHTSAGHFIPIHSRLLQYSSYPYTLDFCRTVQPIHSRLLQDSSYPYSPDFCRTFHTHTVQTSAGQFIPVHSRLLQDSSYPYTLDFCRTVHTHTLQTSKRTVHTLTVCKTVLSRLQFQ